MTLEEDFGHFSAELSQDEGDGGFIPVSRLDAALRDELPGLRMQRQGSTRCRRDCLEREIVVAGSEAAGREE